MQKIAKTLLSFLLASFYLYVNAQTTNVTGKVLSETGEELPSTTITIENVLSGKKQFLVSGLSGTFTIPALKFNEKYNLYFERIGYETDSIKNYSILSNENSSLLIRLKLSKTNLGEVVVVGFGQQRKKNVISAISTIDEKFLANRPITNSTQALQGASGVFVSQNNGGSPGADDATIRIRGIGTLNNNDPLVLVDGIAYNLRDVNPNDIESISVLKDAAAASIYGNRAANGVVLVKTKTGRKGRVVVNYENSFGIQQATYLPDLVSNSADDARLYNQAILNQGVTPNPGVNVFSQAQIDSFAVNSGRQSDKYPSTDWFDVMFRNAFMQQHNVRFSGGSDKSLYSLSVGYQDQDGIVIGTNAKRYSLASNVSFDVSERLKVGFNLNGAFWIQNQSPAGTSGMLSTIYRMRPFFGSTLANGNYFNNWLPLSLMNAQNILRNPYAMATTGSNQTKTSDILANLYIEYKLPFNLKYKVNFGVTKRDENQKIFSPSTLLYNPNTGVATPLDWNGITGRQIKSVSKSNDNSLNTTFFQTLTWDRSIANNHNLNFLLGNSFENFTNESTSAYAEGLVSNSVSELSNGTLNFRVNSAYGQNKLVSFFGRMGYNLSEKYLAEFSFRYDGSSRFRTGNRWGFFPSASIGWRIDKEGFFKDISSTIPYLKLRASWGQLGNQNIADFSYLTNYVNSVAQGYSFGTTAVAGAAPIQLPNPDISWERTTTTNIGVDASFFKSRLTLNVDYFNRLTSDILTNLIIPNQVGNLAGPITNLFSMRNSGIELSLGYRNRSGELSYDVNGNITYINNEVVDLRGQQQINGLTIIKEGYSVNSFYLLDAIGIFQDSAAIKRHAFQSNRTGPGDLIFKDQDSTNTIGGNDRIVTGRSFPKFTYSLSFALAYKGFDMSAFFQGVADVQTYLTLNGIQPFFNGAGVTKDWATNSWTPDRPNATLPRLTTANGYAQNFEGIAGSTWWLRDASYLRLKNLQIGYTLPGSWLARAGISKARLFVNGQNLLTFSKLEITDPERANTSNTIYSYPTTKIYSGGVSLTF